MFVSQAYLAALAFYTVLVPPARASDDPLPSDPVFELRTLEGEMFSGRLAEIGDDLTIRIQDEAGGERSLRLEQLFSFARGDGAPPRATRADGALLLSGGDVLTGQVMRSDADQVILRNPAFGAVELPLDSLEGLILDAAASLEPRDERIEAIRSEVRESDIFWLANRDRLVGTFVSLNEQEVALERDGQATNLSRPQVVAIGFDPTLVRPSEPPARALEIHTRSGGRLTATSAKLVDGALKIELPRGVRLSLPLVEIARVYARSAASEFLTDRPFAAQENVAYVGPARAARIDRNVLGQPLKAGGRHFPRGIGAQSRSLLAFRLEPDDRRYVSEAAVDDAASEWGSVVFRVLIDGEPAFESGVRRKGDPPIKVNLTVAGGRVLILIAEFGPTGSVQDYADWVEPHLVK